MRVCFISFEYPPEVMGGLGAYAYQLVKGFRDKGIDVLTITRGNRNEYGEKVIRILTPDVLYLRRFFFIDKAIRLFHRLNKSRKFDLVHLNGAYPITQSLGIPTVCTFHSTNFLQFVSGFRSLNSIKTLEDQSSLLLSNPIGIFCDIFSARISDRIICPCPSIARELQSHCFVKGEKIRVIPNGFDAETLMGTKALNVSSLMRYGIEKDKFVLFVGRLTWRKGVNYLIDAFKSVHDDFGGLKLVIVGDGPSMPYLKNATRDMHFVLFTGQVSDSIKKLLYESCIVVVVPSTYDVLPTVVLEAMMNNKPVIATNVGGIPFMVRNGKNGLLVSPRDRKSLSGAIKTLCQNPDLGKRMGNCGGRVVKKFSSGRMLRETLKVYEDLLSYATPS
jgi:glycosyltransferase involved in cell wall biosynthesis